MSNDALQDELLLNYKLLVVTFFWAEGRRDRKSFVEAEHIIAASLPRDKGDYRLSSRQGGAMLLRSISQRPVDPYVRGKWDCWLVPDVHVSNVDVAARIGEAAAAMKVTVL